MELAGRRYQRKESDQPYRRWGSQRGSVYLGDQKVPVEVPRVRNVDSDTEVALDAYQALQTPRKMDEGLLRKVLKGIATRNYEDCAETVPETFGLSRSSVSRRYVKGTARKLAEFQERSLEGYDLVALFLDGKSFADEELIIALGVTLDGHKIPLGFVEAATENERVCRRFLADLVDRGLQYEAGLLVLIDGAKGLYKAVMSVLKGHACVQRCQYHKRKNVVSYLPKSEQARVRRKIEAAYNKPTYEEAKATLKALKPGLKLMKGVFEMTKQKKGVRVGRFSARRKQEAVLRLLRGEDLEVLSRELGVMAATLSEWREQFLGGGESALHSRTRDERDEQIARLKAKVGDLTMDNELLESKIHRLEDGLPLASRRSKR